MDMQEFTAYTTAVIAACAFICITWRDIIHNKPLTESRLADWGREQHFPNKKYRPAIYGVCADNYGSEILYIGKSSRLPSLDRFYEHIGQGSFGQAASPIGEWVLAGGRIDHAIKIFDLPAAMEPYAIWHFDPLLNATDKPLPQ